MTSISKITVLIADDHSVFREGLGILISNDEQIKVIGNAGNREEIFRYLSDTHVDVILMDIDLGKDNGIDITKEVKKENPNVKVLALSMHEEGTYIFKMLEAGANGYLLKNTSSAELINAIKTVHGGDPFFSQQVSAKLLQQIQGKKELSKMTASAPLTRREKEILSLIAEEYSNSEIAEKLFISIRTVDTHKRNLIEKLNVKNTAGLVKYAIKNGFIE